ncbi:MAG: serine/threonine-protein kinase [Myxococcota bacterium]|jgi:serine/threonine-protein kinase|nr:serine/threonine-protein kinase [Myxococcota bacterium]
MDATDYLLPGSTIANRFRIRETLSSGATGVVYAADDTQRGQPIALKVYHPQLSANPAFEARLRGVMAAISENPHPNIATALGCGVAQGKLFCAMELVGGESVADKLEKHVEFASFEVESIIKQILHAIEPLHQRGFFNHDLKPKHIRILPGGAVKLVGLGASPPFSTNILRAFPNAVQGSGTPGYVAPELLNGEEPSAAADIYSVGLVAYEMLTNKPAYGVDNELARASAQLSRPPDAAEMDIQMLASWRVIEQMFDRNPLVRYNSVEMVIEDLDEASGATPEAGSTMAVPLTHLFMADLANLAPKPSPAPTPQQLFGDDAEDVEEIEELDASELETELEEPFPEPPMPAAPSPNAPLDLAPSGRELARLSITAAAAEAAPRRSLPQAPLVLRQPTPIQHKSKVRTILFILIVLLLCAGAFAAVWFFVLR